MNAKTKKTLWIAVCILFPGVLVLWLIYKLWRELLIVIFCAGIMGCANNSAALDRSPCACDFGPANIVIQEGGKNG
jgi:hypothetical protein